MNIKYIFTITPCLAILLGTNAQAYQTRFSCPSISKTAIVGLGKSAPHPTNENWWAYGSKKTMHGHAFYEATVNLYGEVKAKTGVLPGKKTIGFFQGSQTKYIVGETNNAEVEKVFPPKASVNEASKPQCKYTVRIKNLDTSSPFDMFHNINTSFQPYSGYTLTNCSIEDEQFRCTLTKT